MQNTRQKTYAHGNATPNNLKSESEFVNKKIYIEIHK